MTRPPAAAEDPPLSCIHAPHARTLSCGAVQALDQVLACDPVPRAPCCAGPYFHPHTYSAGEASADTLAKLRGEGCGLPEGLDPQAALQRAAAAAAAEGGEADGVNGGSGGSSARGAAAAGSGGGDAWRRALEAAGAPLMPPRCPLFARKMDAEAAQQWSDMLHLEGAVRRR